ncbi:hypothetical protein V6N13_101546 [Hibiscus sabdariffa]|uniref:Uncharacterized protein n=1 Tax=Hibiscus sabdariffa TaxID=183260 RepID=A0ABR2QLN1_9ROSI
MIDNLSQDLKSLSNRVDRTTHHLAQMLNSLLSFITLTLACKCRRKTLICLLFFTGKEPTVSHNLYHLATLCIRHMYWLFIVYDQDYGAAFDEIFLLLPQILGNDPSFSSAWSLMHIESRIWELDLMRTSEIDLPSMFVGELIQQVADVESIRSLAEIHNKITAKVVTSKVLIESSRALTTNSLLETRLNEFLELEVDSRKGRTRQRGASQDHDLNDRCGSEALEQIHV